MHQYEFYIPQGTHTVKQVYSYQKQRFGKGWTVFEVSTGHMYMSVPTRLRAQYVCAKLNGVDLSKVFYFGDR